MKLFRQVMSGIDPTPLLAQVAEHPELFGAHDSWTAGKPGTAISQMGMAKNYIELRYNRDWPHWDRPPRKALTEAEPLIDRLMAAVGGTLLGRVTISRMEPGEVIPPHAHQAADGSRLIWETHQIPLQSDPGVWFYCGNESVWMEPGTAWAFPSWLEHSVENRSQRPRLSMMLDIKVH